MAFGDGIDWNHEARRAAAEAPPGDGKGELLVHIRQVLGDAPGLRVVDCGCNIARFYPQFAANGFSYTGVDQAPEAIAVARKRYPEATFIHSFLWEDWPSQQMPFDAAFCNAVLQHNQHEEKRKILARIAKAVRVGGVFAMQESVVLAETATQLRQNQWVQLVEGYGFKLLKTWHKNEYDLDDGFIFQRTGA